MKSYSLRTFMRSEIVKKNLSNNKFVSLFREFIVKERGVIGGSILEYVSVAAVYLLIIYLITGTVMLNMGTQIYAEPGDSTAGFLWLNSTDHTLNPFVGHYDNTNYPFGEDASGLTLIAYFAYWMPMRLLSVIFSPIAALNITMLVGYLLSAMGMYTVVKRITGRKLIALTAGFAAAFVPYALIKSVFHLSYIFGGIFTLIIGCFLALWQRPTLKKGALLAVLVGLTLYMDGYFVLMSVVLGVSMILSGLLYSLIKKDNRAEWVLRLKSVAVAAGVFLLMAIPILTVNAIAGKQIAADLSSSRSDLASEMAAYRSNKIDFLLPQAGSFIWGDNETFRDIDSYKNTRSNSGENTHYISVFIYIVSAVGLVIFLVRLVASSRSSIRLIPDTVIHPVGLLLILTTITSIFSLSMMFSPDISIMGLKIPLPGTLLLQNDIAFWRVMSRLFVVFNVAVVLWFGVSLWLCVLSLKHSRFAKGRLSSFIAVALVLVVFGLVALDYRTNFPSRPYDFTKTMQTYKWLKSQDSIKSIALLPLVDPLDSKVSEYVTAQITHGKSIVNLKVPNDKRLSNVLGLGFDEETLNFVRDRKVDAVLFYSDNCERPDIGKVLFEEPIDRLTPQGPGNAKVMLCTLGVDQQKYIDPVYAVFSNGFIPTPNSLDQSVFHLKKGGSGIIKLTVDDLRSRYQGKVDFRADIRLVRPVVGSSWRISQSSKLLASGSFNGTDISNLEVEVDGGKDVKLEVVTPGYDLGPAESYIRGVIVTANQVSGN